VLIAVIDVTGLMSNIDIYKSRPWGPQWGLGLVVVAIGAYIDRSYR
jgi:hypothetical protein